MKTVADLIEALKQYPQDAQVVQASDAEGNDFEEWYDIAHGRWDGEEFRTTVEDDYSERDLTDDECDTICLWP